MKSFAGVNYTYMSSLTPEGIIPFLLYFILKNWVDGGKICSLYGAGEIFISLTLRVWVFWSSNPANLTIAGEAVNIPFDPTASNLLLRLR